MRWKPLLKCIHYNECVVASKRDLKNKSVSVKQSLFARLGRLIYHNRVWAIIVWGLLTLVSLALTPSLENALQETGVVDETGVAYRTQQLLQQELKLDPNALTLVFQRFQNSASDTAQGEMEQTLNSVRSLPVVSKVVSVKEHPEYQSTDGLTQYSVIQLRAKDRGLVPAIDQIEQVLLQQKSQQVRTFLTGKPAIDREVQRIGKADLGRVELSILPVMLVVLVVVFGSIVAATMPLAMGMIAVSVTLGLLYLVTLKLSVSVFALNLTSMLGLGLGIDYSLLMVNRFQQELRSLSVKQAITETLDTAGRAVFFSGLTVCIGLVGLMLFPFRLLQSLGIAGAIVVALSVMTALTLLPALLSVVGHQINYGSIFPVTTKQQEWWSKIARTVIRHSVVAVMIILLIIAGLTAPFFAARFGVGSADTLPKSVSARAGVEVLNQAFGVGETAPILLAIQSKTPGDSILSKRHIATLYTFVTDLKTDSRIANVQSLVNLEPNLTLNDYQQLYGNPANFPAPKIAAALKQLSHDETTLVVVKSRTAMHDAASRSLVQDLRRLQLEGLQIQVAGQTASELDTLAAIEQRLPLILTIIMVATFIVLAVLLNSVILPLKALVMNLFSMGASFGALVFIFQWGNFQTWLKFTPVGYLDILLPVVLFCVLFGLSMDYEVFLLTRIKEAYDFTGNNSTSIIAGLEQTGQIITSAALLIIIVTSAFAFTSLIFVKALGLGIAIAIAIDATLIRVILVPATMHLMGKWNWWFPWR